MRPIGLLALGAATAALGACGSADNKRRVADGKGGVVLTASPAKPSFHREEPVALDVTLSNHGSAPISASTSALGTLRIVSLQRDGKPVAPRRTFLRTQEDLATLLRTSLREVPAGDSLRLSWKSIFNQGVGGQAFYSVRVERLKNALDVYSVGVPGAYVLKLAYEYPGAAEPSGSTFTGPTKPTTVSFDVAR